MPRSMKVKSVYHKKEDRANQSPAPSARSVIVQPDVVVGGGVPRRLLYSALNSIEKSKSFPPLSVIPAPIGDPGLLPTAFIR